MFPRCVRLVLRVSLVGVMELGVLCFYCTVATIFGSQLDCVMNLRKPDLICNLNVSLSSMNSRNSRMNLLKRLKLLGNDNLPILYETTVMLLLFLFGLRYLRFIGTVKVYLPEFDLPTTLIVDFYVFWSVRKGFALLRKRLLSKKIVEWGIFK